MPQEDREALDRLHSAVERIVDEHWRRDGSLFTPGRAVATVGNLETLNAKFRGQMDEGGDSFLTKFERQLSDASDEVVLLAAELLYVHLSFADDIGGPSKRRTIGKVLSWLDQPVSIPSDLDAALDAGFGNTGVAFKTYRPHQLWFLIDAMLGWKRATPQDRDRWLSDPWACKQFLFDVPITAAYSQREALLYLLHPDTFEPIASREHKQRIAETFDDRLDEATGDVDRDLHRIRQALADERGQFRHFYEAGIVEVWRGPAEAPSPRGGGTPPKAWLVRNKIGGGASLLGQWLQEGYAAIGWQDLGPEAIDLDRDGLAELMAKTYPDHAPGRLRNATGNVSRFLHQMRPGDLLVSSDGDAIHVGIVDSDPAFVAGSPEAYRRGVEWANPELPISRADLPAAAYSKLRTLLTVSDVSADIADFASLAGMELEAAETRTPIPAKRSRFELPAADDVLATQLLISRPWLQEIIDLLAGKRQVIFYGPPGTGKTYLAQRIADHLTKAGGTYTLVQFHPSYAYEDFFEGFRPRPSETAGGVSFELVPGPLRSIAEQAADDPDNPYLLVIDEINRANLAKVFGEMYFLLEYREAAIALQYSPEEEFALPKNLFIIGTMNTADRSIARVDAAMRRRFYFVPFFPQQPPIAGLLDRWLGREGHDRAPAALLDEVNRRIDDPDVAVGPSYLMNSEVSRDGGLERIWRHSILPLLEEHYLGTGVDVSARFGLDALRRALRTSVAQPLTGEAADTGGDDHAPDAEYEASGDETSTA